LPYHRHMRENCDADGSSALPGLTRTAVERLSADWDDGGLWRDVLFLADRFWQARDEELRLLRWHHLVLAVGNFKRENGRRLRPATLHASIPGSQVARSPELTVPGLGPDARLDVGGKETWLALSGRLKGAAVPTTTTLLSALWPEQHFVFDRYVRIAVNALRISECLDGTPGAIPSSASPLPSPISFTDYELSRKWILKASSELNVPITLAERSLYQLARRFDSNIDRTWQEYAHCVREFLAGYQ
jgi:hypothetical protein